jgi:ribosome-binding factor A
MSERRRERLARELLREISQIVLYGMKDRSVGFVTFTRSTVSADMKYAKVYFSALGEDADRRRSLQALKHARKFIQAEIAHRMNFLRYVPEISFHIDESVEGAVRVSKLIDEAAREIRAFEDRGGVLPPRPAAPSPDAPGGKE